MKLRLFYVTSGPAHIVDEDNRTYGTVTVMAAQARIQRVLDKTRDLTHYQLGPNTAPLGNMPRNAWDAFELAWAFALTEDEPLAAIREDFELFIDGKEADAAHEASGAAKWDDHPMV